MPLTGERDGQTVLEDLERRNLFVVALDDRREWYRYHHLFADVLQKQLRAKDPDGVRAVHRRASVWYEAHGSPADAIRHALGAEDLERAAGLLEQAWPEKDRSYESRKWLDQVKTLPDPVIRARPVLSMGYAWALLNNGELEAVEPRLRDVERWLQQSTAESNDRNLSSSAQMVVSDRNAFARCPPKLPPRASTSHSRSATFPERWSTRNARSISFRQATCPDARQAPHSSRSPSGDAEISRLRTGHSADALTLMREMGGVLDAIRGTFVLGDIRVAQGRLREAARIYEQGLQLAAEEVHAAPPETDELHLGLSECIASGTTSSRAIGFLDAITRSAAQTAHVGNKLRWCTAMAERSRRSG